jgi:hypothetical protein
MSNNLNALRTAAKHARSALSQPLRRTFYTPYAALQHSPLSAKPTTTASEAATTTTTTTVTAPAALEHEQEHAARTVYVVAEPNAADFQFYGVPAGAYPISTPYHHPAENVVSLFIPAIIVFMVAHARRKSHLGIDDATSASRAFSGLPFCYYARRQERRGRRGRVMGDDG